MVKFGWIKGVLVSGVKVPPQRCSTAARSHVAPTQHQNVRYYPNSVKLKLRKRTFLRRTHQNFSFSSQTGNEVKIWGMVCVRREEFQSQRWRFLLKLVWRWARCLCFDMRQSHLLCHKLCTNLPFSFIRHPNCGFRATPTLSRKMTWYLLKELKPLQSQIFLTSIFCIFLIYLNDESQFGVLLLSV